METPDVDSSQAELEQLENAYWKAMKEGDAERAIRLTGFPCLVAGPQGPHSVDEATYRKIMKAKTYSIAAFELSDVTVQLHGRDVAVVVYRLKQDLTVEGEKLMVDCCESSTWVRLDGQWKCVQHAEAIAGDPFGRGRRDDAPSIH